MVETRTLWQKHTDEFREKDGNLPRRKPLYKYRVGMTNSSHSENGVIWWTEESTLTPEETLNVLSQLYPEHEDIDGMAQFWKESYPEETTWQQWHKDLNRYVPMPFDACCDELFAWERNKDVTIDENAYIMATLPSNVEHETPTIGFISHFDTSPDFSGANVKPQIVENYNGKDIVLNTEKKIVLSPDYFEDLHHYKGQTLITTDGTTLLGA